MEYIIVNLFAVNSIKGLEGIIGLKGWNGGYHSLEKNISFYFGNNIQ